MHEMSIAINIVEIAEKEAKKNNAAKIKEIELEIGRLSGVIVEALEFALESAVKNTILENAEFIIHEIEGKCQCRQCQHVFSTDDFIMVCPKCSNFDIKIINGKEMKIKSLVVE